MMNLIDKRNSANNRLAILQELMKIMSQELKALTYPKRIKLALLLYNLCSAWSVCSIALQYMGRIFGRFNIQGAILPIENNGPSIDSFYHWTCSQFCSYRS